MVQDKLDAANRRFQLVGDVATPASAYDRLSLWHDDDLAEAIVDCPVCGLPCLATGYPETAPANFDAAVAVFVEVLACEVCGLHLYAGELQLAGAPLVVPLPNVSATELDGFYSTVMDPPS